MENLLLCWGAGGTHTCLMLEVLRVKTFRGRNTRTARGKLLTPLDLESLLRKIRLELKMSQIASASKFDA